ncbi:hypothetical protein DMH02_009145 [Streptomyces sp. WAC 00631]|uniref:hypothetical protein n=1 Tax=Streptomyces sp. WAC 00631 TaxID=2203201 RepID=UPI00163D120D|nr:hypothetical protein [Streptomyces sp. WAC 00631]MCC5033378.1 hypothetical protein [Streptomyces sp. WAC 00631]
MTLQVVGALCILVALLGEGLKINDLEVSRMSRVRAAALVAVGIAFVGLGLLTDAGAS